MEDGRWTKEDRGWNKEGGAGFSIINPPSSIVNSQEVKDNLFVIEERSRENLLFLLISLIEFLDPAGGIHENFLSGIERMRSGAYLDLDDRVGVAIFPFNGLLGLYG